MDFLLVSLFLSISFVYTCIGIYYRLFLSPIAKFPGPRLAAATYWIEFYYDIIQGGMYIWKIKEWHEIYGPVIRINPHELHVADPAFWDVMFTPSTERNRRDKWEWQTRGIAIPASVLGTAKHTLHRRRRGAINPFFSMQNVRRLLPVVDERVSALIDRLITTGEKGEVVSMEYAFSAFSNDVVMQYCFGRKDNHIEAPQFDPLFHNTSFGAAKSIALLKHCNWILSIMLALPESLAVKMGEEVSSNIRLKRERITQIEEIRRKAPGKEVGSDSKTIFHTLLQSDLPVSEKHTIRLAEEAVLLVGAGTHTRATQWNKILAHDNFVSAPILQNYADYCASVLASWCLTVMTFHLLDKPNLLRRLKAELRSANVEPGRKPALQDLEKLPFLTAVLKEGLRLGYGSTVRSARIAPDTTLECGKWSIPPGTPVSMAIPITHHNEELFPNSHDFDPDRWLSPSSQNLDKYMVAFSRGSRNCLGMNLAWAELYLCAAGVFSHFGSDRVHEASDIGTLMLYKTDQNDVKMIRDMFFPVAKDGSKGVRIMISLRRAAL